jgi:hypothetical protein
MRKPVTILPGDLRLTDVFSVWKVFPPGQNDPAVSLSLDPLPV